MSIYFIYEKPEFSAKSFLENTDPMDNICEFKIGESINPVERCKTLQTGNKRKLIIYKTVFCGTKQQAQAIEASIHDRYANSRISGEWFKISKHEVDQVIQEITRLHDAEIIAAQRRHVTAFINLS